MASAKDLKKRIGTVRNTQQTTRAMKMVSAAKLRRSQEAILSQRPYAKQLAHLLSELLKNEDLEKVSPLLTPSTQEAQILSGPKKILLVLVTSDRGLCGGFNGNIIKAAQRWIESQSTTAQVELAFVGKKGHDGFKKQHYPILQYFQEQSGKVTYVKAKHIAQFLIEHFTQGAFQEIKIIYNQFKNAVTQEVVVEKFLPFQLEQTGSALSEETIPFMVRPSKEELIGELLSKIFSVQIFKILLESQAGEHGARMSAMENATKNAGEMMKKLALQYNKQRQANITKELLEIISGSESQKN